MRKVKQLCISGHICPRCYVQFTLFSTAGRRKVHQRGRSFTGDPKHLPKLIWNVAWQLEKYTRGKVLGRQTEGNKWVGNLDTGEAFCHFASYTK